MPVIAPIPFTIAINVPAQFGLKSKGFTFIPGQNVPMRPMAIVKSTTEFVLLHPAYEANTVKTAGPMAAIEIHRKWELEFKVIAKK